MCIAAPPLADAPTTDTPDSADTQDDAELPPPPSYHTSLLFESELKKVNAPFLSATGIHIMDPFANATAETAAHATPEAYDAVAATWSSAVRTHMIQTVFDMTTAYESQDDAAFDRIEAALSTQPDFKRLIESGVDSTLVLYEHVLPRWAPGDPRLPRAQAAARRMVATTRANDASATALLTHAVDALELVMNTMKQFSR